MANDNYPDDIRQYDNHPGSPFFEEPPHCEKCGKLCVFEQDGDGGVDDLHICRDELQAIVEDEEKIATVISELNAEKYVELNAAINLSLSGLGFFMAIALDDSDCWEYQLVLAKAFQHDAKKNEDEGRLPTDAYNIIFDAIEKAAEEIT
jgi:hypothetical protein